MTYDEKTFEPRILMSLPMFDLRSGKVNGVLLWKIRLNKIWGNVVARSIGKSGTIFITNSGGKVVAHQDPSVIYKNTFYEAITSKDIQPGINGEEVMLVTDKFNMGNRTFLVYGTLPLKEVINLSLQTLSTTAAFVFVFIILSIVVSYLALNRIVRPIESLADSARQISAGKLGPTVQVGNTDEIGDLSNAFNSMTTRLVDTINSLKQQIAKREYAENEYNRMNY